MLQISFEIINYIVSRTLQIYIRAHKMFHNLIMGKPSHIDRNSHVLLAGEYPEEKI